MRALENDYLRLLKESGWLWSVDPALTRAGHDLQRLGLVWRLQAHPVARGQLKLLSQVRSLRGKRHETVLIFLSRQPNGKVMIASTCSCAASGLCVHAIATVYDFIESCSVDSKDGASPRASAVDIRERSSRRPKEERIHLACCIVPLRDGGVALDVLYSGRPVLSGHGHLACTVTNLFDSKWADRLSKASMRKLALEFQQHVSDDDSDAPVRLTPPPERWDAWLDALLKWQLLYWGGGPNPVMLHPGPARAVKPEWVFVREREVCLTSWKPGGESMAWIPGSPPWYVDTKKRLCGTLATAPLGKGDAAWWIGGNRRPARKEVREVNARRRRENHKGRFPLPPNHNEIDGGAIVPQCVLHLAPKELPRSTMRSFWSPVFVEQPTAQLRFRYGAHTLAENRQPWALEDASIRVLRNVDAESDAAKTLEQWGLPRFAPNLPDEALTDEMEAVRWVGTWEKTASQTAWMRFMTEKLQALEKQGWTIEYDARFDMRFVLPDRWIQELRETRNKSWFDFELGIECEGQIIDLIPILISYLESTGDLEAKLAGATADAHIPVRLPDGRFLAFPAARLRPILKVLNDLVEGKSTRKKDRVLHRLVAAELLADSEDTAMNGRGAEELRAVAKRVESFAGIEKTLLPSGLQAELRRYQQVGLDWLQFLARYGMGGILADDMGLGKTLQAIAHLLAEKETGRLTKPALIVTPTSLLGNWQDEIARFAPALKVHLYYGLDRHDNGQAFDAADIILTSYALTHRDEAFLEKCYFSHLILDEAQNIKNPASKAAQTLCRLHAEHRLCLSGTPMENNLEELWSLFHFLMPGLLGRLETFRRRFRQPIERDDNVEVRRLLAHRVGPLMLRRKKTEVATELPPKTEMVRSVELEGPQRDLYETIRASMQQRVQEVIAEQGIERAHLYILEALLKLRQVCCHPHLLKLEAAQSLTISAKTELLFELLPEMICEGRRVLLFSQFTSMLALIGDRLRAEGIPFVKLTGSTRNRSEVVRQFQEGEAPLFLISLKAGGVGLNLTRADTVIHYDPWWNPAVENQATDRAYRIGQDQPVFVYKLITRGTIEERIVAMQEEKKELVESLFSEGRRQGKGLSFSKGDLERLLRPIE